MMPAPKKKKPARKRAAKKPPEPIRDHSGVVTAPAGTPEKAVIDHLTGADQVPSLDELSQAKAPPFDPHAGREVEHGREFGDTAEPMLTTLVFMGLDYGGSFEDDVQALVSLAEKIGMHYVTATVSKLDLHAHFEALDEMDRVTPDDEDDDEDEPDEERLDEEKF
jgi:hypothetical protein